MKKSLRPFIPPKEYSLMMPDSNQREREREKTRRDELIDFGNGKHCPIAME